ncbi:MAG: hypothetical protein WDO18_07760 [Acidobacteriota bacterium]
MSRKPKASRPQIKRRLNIEHLIPEIKPGMMGAVEYGTARRIGFNDDTPIYGKTGTCTDSRTPTHLGWFGSFTEVGHQRVAVVVMLTGGSAVSGPSAAGVAGEVLPQPDPRRLLRSRSRGRASGRRRRPVKAAFPAARVLESAVNAYRSFFS